jgi:exodeoxyribonuclease-3
MRIATWNVNSVRTRQQQVLAWLAAERPEVHCLQEPKV